MGWRWWLRGAGEGDGGSDEVKGALLVGGGVASIGVGLVVWVKLTSLRVRVARCSSRPLKLRSVAPLASWWRAALVLAAAERWAGATGFSRAGGFSSV
ncbi:possible membrane protein (plasmid) [Mycobacterium ulcerans Agy99]|uniref:Possible membrane protein n=1 Tax=Mycobacterium ulcerans (strain Agy99) TaxID=362242 RepID=Q6MZ65_MYCUA|nr:possible membrane protein [Mycobacterium ulcerans Agy99]